MGLVRNKIPLAHKMFVTMFATICFSCAASAEYVVNPFRDEILMHLATNKFGHAGLGMRPLEVS